MAAANRIMSRTPGGSKSIKDVSCEATMSLRVATSWPGWFGESGGETLEEGKELSTRRRRKRYMPTGLVLGGKLKDNSQQESRSKERFKKVRSVPICQRIATMEGDPLKAYLRKKEL